MKNSIDKAITKERVTSILKVIAFQQTILDALVIDKNDDTLLVYHECAKRRIRELGAELRFLNKRLNK